LRISRALTKELSTEVPKRRLKISSNISSNKLKRNTISIYQYNYTEVSKRLLRISPKSFRKTITNNFPKKNFRNIFKTSQRAILSGNCQTIDQYFSMKYLHRKHCVQPYNIQIL